MGFARAQPAACLANNRLANNRLAHAHAHVRPAARPGPLLAYALPPTLLPTPLPPTPCPGPLRGKLFQIVLGLMCPAGLSGGGESQNGAKSRRFGMDMPSRAFYEGVNPKTILNN